MFVCFEYTTYPYQYSAIVYQCIHLCPIARVRDRIQRRALAREWLCRIQDTHLRVRVPVVHQHDQRPKNNCDCFVLLFLFYTIPIYLPDIHIIVVVISWHPLDTCTGVVFGHCAGDYGTLSTVYKAFYCSFIYYFPYCNQLK
jgi:hypothetical protein